MVDKSMEVVMCDAPNPPKKRRKIVAQIRGTAKLTVLCDDGSLWYHGVSAGAPQVRWNRIDTTEVEESE